MDRPPDLFEIRLDHFKTIDHELERKMSILPAPLIITARHPREGGAHNLSTQRRRELLWRFLRYARYLDVELRSTRSLKPLLVAARRKNIGRIISFHDLKSTPPAASLRAKAATAKRYGADIFKVATRTETRAQLAQLFDFIAHPDVDLPLSVMGVGKLGRQSRRELMPRGSVLVYGHLGRVRLAGQPSLAEIQRWTFGVEH
jgi:3-dehydroquinate dehydratase-1